MDRQQTGRWALCGPRPGSRASGLCIPACPHQVLRPQVVHRRGAHFGPACIALPSGATARAPAARAADVYSHGVYGHGVTGAVHQHCGGASVRGERLQTKMEGTAGKSTSPRPLAVNGPCSGVDPEWTRPWPAPGKARAGYEGWSVARRLPARAPPRRAGRPRRRAALSRRRTATSLSVHSGIRLGRWEACPP